MAALSLQGGPDEQPPQELTPGKPGLGRRLATSPSSRPATSSSSPPTRTSTRTGSRPTITSGAYQGTDYTAIPAPAAAPIEPGDRIEDTPTYVGDACTPVSAGDGGVALVERGGVAPDGTACSFQLKLNNVKAAGYTAGIVLNNVRPDCLAFVNMLAAGDIPFIHVNRVTGLQLLGVAGVTDQNACTTPTPAAGSASARPPVSGRPRPITRLWRAPGRSAGPGHAPHSRRAPCGCSSTSCG